MDKVVEERPYTKGYRKETKGNLRAKSEAMRWRKGLGEERSDE